MNKSKLYNLSKEELQRLLDNSNSYSDVLKHLDLSHPNNQKKLKQIIKDYNLDTSKLEINRKNKNSQPNKPIDFKDKLTKNSTMSSNKIKKKLFKSQIKEEKCEICGITEWNNKNIILQIHHIDGDHTNNELSNLQILCPNCHSQTDNFCTKKKKEVYVCKNCGKRIRKNKSGLCIDCIKLFSIQKLEPLENNRRQSIIYDLTKDEFQCLLDNSNSYEELKQYFKLSGGSSNRTIKRAIISYNLDTTKFEENVKNHKKTNIDEVLTKNSNIQSDKLKEKLIENNLKEEKCEICGITEWNNKDITLQLHHIDGDHTNNELSNLQILCPNCHSQTDNFCIKNVKRIEVKKSYRKKQELCPICNKYMKEKAAKMCIECYHEKLEQNITKKISREELKKLIRNTSFYQIGKMFNVSGNTIKKWCDKYNLPRRKCDIEKYTDLEWENI